MAKYAVCGRADLVHLAALSASRFEEMARFIGYEPLGRKEYKTSGEGTNPNYAARLLSVA